MWSCQCAAGGPYCAPHELRVLFEPFVLTAVPQLGCVCALHCVLPLCCAPAASRQLWFALAVSSALLRSRSLLSVLRSGAFESRARCTCLCLPATLLEEGVLHTGVACAEFAHQRWVYAPLCRSELRGSACSAQMQPIRSQPVVILVAPLCHLLLLLISSIRCIQTVTFVSKQLCHHQQVDELQLVASTILEALY
jgi:hypothetical protein